MVSTRGAQSTVAQLQAALGALELPNQSPLRSEVLNLCERLKNPNIRIAVFGPFNYGKSTLLNALLGDKTLPMDLIPTTGAAILVKYGDRLHSRITFKNGSQTESEGTEILKDYAILDEQRRMNDDVQSVEVECPHEFLRTGVEFLDLPGTDDQTAQNELVKTQLLTANVVIQLLDGRKLMTLGEREHLRDWLLDRGIETVVFVVNFLNLMEPEDQKQVMRRMRFVAESFRSNLPSGMSNLYRVDALPALRACLKGDRDQVEVSGLPTLETALQRITHSLSDNTGTVSNTQIKTVQSQLQNAVNQKITELTTSLEQDSQAKQTKKIKLKRQAQELIAKGFSNYCDTVEEWAATKNLLRNYGRSLTMALIEDKYSTWLDEDLKEGWNEHRQKLVGWVKKASDFFQLPAPPIPIVQFPVKPTVEVKAKATKSSETAKPSDTPKKIEEEAVPVAIAAGLGWLMGGPVGAAVIGGASYVLTQTSEKLIAVSSNDKGEENPVEVDLAYAEAAELYLSSVSQEVLKAIALYRTHTHDLLHPKIQSEPSIKQTTESAQLSLLKSVLENLEDL